MVKPVESFNCLDIFLYYATLTLFFSQLFLKNVSIKELMRNRDTT